MIATVYTANIDYHDNLRAPSIRSENARYVCFANEPLNLPAPWELLPAHWAVYNDASRNVRVHKALSHVFTETEYSIWMDANMEMLVDPIQLLHRALNGGFHMAVFRHPARACIYDEAQICANERLEDQDLLARQVRRYREEGYPANNGLAACGVILRRNDTKVREFNECWWSEILNEGKRDQISFPYAVWKTGIQVNYLEYDIFDNPLFRYHKHAASGHEENDAYRKIFDDANWRRHTLRRLCTKRLL